MVQKFTSTSFVWIFGTPMMEAMRKTDLLKHTSAKDEACNFHLTKSIFIDDAKANSLKIREFETFVRQRLILN